MIVKIKYKPGMLPIKQAPPGEWYDLRAAETIVYRKGDFVRIPLGVAMEMPKGWEAMMQPRSSTSEKYGLLWATSGVIDNGFHGDDDWWCTKWYAVEDGMILKNTRICQFRFQREQPKDVQFERVKIFGNKNRGGYGSTGEE
jgi:dUTP pyrophosphatase